MASGTSALTSIATAFSGRGIDQGIIDIITGLKNDIAALRASLPGILVGSETFDAGSIADGDEEAAEITVTGAALGDFVLVSSSLDVADLAITAAVTAADTVTYQLNNNTGGAIDLAEVTIRVLVISKAAVALAAATVTA